MPVVGGLESALAARALTVTAFAALAAIGRWSLDEAISSAMPVSICAARLAGVRVYQLA
jgi:tRNA threonylcarbamoyladenosine modification (KEOPS) complex Cgi121 subunit